MAHILGQKYLMPASEELRKGILPATAYVPAPEPEKSETRDLGATVDRLAELIGPSPQPARVLLRFRKAGMTRCWILETGPQGCTVSTQLGDGPDLEILIVEEAWWQIVEGRLTPTEAFTHGMLVAHGDLKQALSLMTRIQLRVRLAAPVTAPVGDESPVKSADGSEIIDPVHEGSETWRAFRLLLLAGTQVSVFLGGYMGFVYFAYGT